MAANKFPSMLLKKNDNLYQSTKGKNELWAHTGFYDYAISAVLKRKRTQKGPPLHLTNCYREKILQYHVYILPAKHHRCQNKEQIFHTVNFLVFKFLAFVFPLTYRRPMYKIKLYTREYKQKTTGMIKPLYELCQINDNLQVQNAATGPLLKTISICYFGYFSILLLIGGIVLRYA